MKKSASYNHFLDKVTGGAMPKFNYSKPPSERYRLI